MDSVFKECFKNTAVVFFKEVEQKILYHYPFDATADHRSGFKSPYTLSEEFHRTLHYEFLEPAKDGVVFESE